MIFDLCALLYHIGAKLESGKQVSGLVNAETTTVRALPITEIGAWHFTTLVFNSPKRGLRHMYETNGVDINWADSYVKLNKVYGHKVTKNYIIQV